MSELATRSSTPVPECQWCQRELTQPQGRGRRRKYCSDSCKQRAYEHRNDVANPPRTFDVENMSEKREDSLRDKLFELRCAAEDIATAAGEGAQPQEIEELCAELVTMAKKIEKFR